jgi:tripartite-type tricarboxylate transporter receptor subunit TctC
MKAPQRLLHLLAGIAFGCLAMSAASADTYPSRTVKIISPTAPGGPTDLVARLLADKLSTMWGQQVIVENRAGAGHMIGTDAAAKAAPDGYTFVVVTTPHVTNPALRSTMSFDSVKDFTPVSLIASLPVVLVVTPALPVNNVKDLIAHAKARPGALRVASAGNATGPHLAAALFQQMAGVEFQHIPYKGGPQATTAVMSGEVELYFDSPASALPQIQAGKLKGLGTTGLTRPAAAGNLPTIAETVPGFSFDVWNGLLAPAGLPPEILAKVNKDVVAVLAMPDVKAKLEALMFEPRGTTPQELGKLIDGELVRWAKIIKDGNIRAE